MPTNARKLHRIGTGGPWGTGLLLLGIAVVAQGIGYFVRDEATVSPAIAQLFGLPLWVWAIAWFCAGIWCIRQALTPPQKHSDVWPAVAVTVLWTAAYAIHWFTRGIEGHWDTSWASAVGWGGLACLIMSWARCVNPPVRDR